MRTIAKHILWLMLIMVVALGMSGCSGGLQTSNNTAHEGRDEDFVWGENTILGLSETGMKKKVLTIPSRCEGFLGAIFVTGEERTEEIIFESDEEFPLNGQFSGVEQLKKVELPDGQTVINNMEFYCCRGLEQFRVPAAVVKIGDSAFKDASSLKTVDFGGEKVREIGKGAFQECAALSEIMLPDTVESIAEKAFYKCTSLSRVTLPKSLTRVGAFAFANSGLSELFFPEEVTLEEYYDTSFVQTEQQVTVYVKAGSWADVNFHLMFDNSYLKEYW